MKKVIITIIIILSAIGIGAWWYFSNKNDNEPQQNNYQAEKSSTNINANNTNTDAKTNTNTNTIPNSTETKQPETSKQPEQPKPKVETEIAAFSTKIYNKDSERQNNITITCKAISGKEIQPNEVFSFCDTVGKSTSSKGYQEADIYVDGEKKQGLGGGNCQVSTTLYNAVAKIPELEVVERHQHSGHVPYIKEGQDAAVAYGSYDFKFKNNTGSVIKVVMENTSENITAKIIKIS